MTVIPAQARHEVKLSGAIREVITAARIPTPGASAAQVLSV